MKNINEYKKRFYNLMESTMGDAKPLISEQETPINSVSGETVNSGGGGAAVESVANVIKRFPQIPITVTPKKHTNGITVTWSEKPANGVGGVVTYYADCNTGILTKYNGEVSVAEKTARSVLTTSLCRSLIPNSQVVKNQDEYTKKQAEYIKDHPLQTGSPTHYRSDGSSTLTN